MRTVSSAAYGISLVILLLVCSGLRAGADQIVMQNGDRYAGRVVALTNDLLIVQSDVLGVVRLPRNRISSITMGSSMPADEQKVRGATNLQSLAKAPLGDTNTDISLALKQLGANTNFIQQVQQQFLGDAGPEANNKYNELVGGLMSGRLTLDDLRAQARSAADQLRALKKDMGDDAGFAIDGYLGILDSFLKEAGLASSGVKGSGTNAVPAKAKSSSPESGEQ